MDAAHNSFRKYALLFAIALLVLAAPLSAQQLNLSTSSVTLGNQSQTVQVTSTTATQITFTTAVDYSGDANNPGGVVHWLSVTADNNATTPSNVFLSVSNTAGLAAGQHTAVVTLHGTSPAGVTDKTITVTFTVGSGGGGGGTGNITVSPTTNVVLSASPGFGASQQLTLTTASASPVSFTISTILQSWLHASSSNTVVSAASPVTLTVSADALAAGQYSGNFSINPTGGTSVPISVQFNVGQGGSSGTYQVGNNNITLNYPSGTNSQTVTVSSNNSAVTSYNATTSSGNAWLLVNGFTQVFGVPVGNSLTLSVGAAAAQLATGTYNGQVTISNPTNSSDATTIFVTLSVNGGGGNGSGVLNPTSLSFNTTVNGSIQSQQVNVTGTNPSASIGNCNGNAVGVTFSGTNTFNVTVYPAAFGNVTQTYNCSLAFTVGGSTYNLPLTIFVGTGTGGGGGSGATLAPTSLQFAYQAGQSSVPPGQQVSVTGTTVSSVSTTVNGGSANFISANSSGSGVFVSVIGGLSAGTYSGTVNVNFANGGSQPVTVNLNVASGPVVVANPGTLNLSYTSGSSGATQSATVQLFASDGSGINITNATSSQSWVQVGTPTSTTTPANYPITVTASGLPNGLNTANLTFTATGANNSPVTVPVVVLVSGSTGGNGSLTLGASSLTFAGVVNGQAPASQTLGVTAASATNFTVSVSGSNCNWLSVSPSGAQTTPANLTVTATQTGLGTGSYTCNINLVANGVTQTVPVTLNVSTTGGGGGSGNITVTPTSMSFTAIQNQGNPAVQGLQISSQSGQSPVGFTFSINTTSGGNWLSTGVPSGTSLTTPVTLSVSVGATSLSPGTYNGNIVITPTGGQQVTVPVTLTIQSLTVSASPTELTFSYRDGDATPASQTISVTGGTGLPFAATAASTNNWLTVSPTSGSTPGNMTVSVNPTNLASGTYNGTIVVNGTGTATGTTTVNVTLNVTAPLPTVTRVTNGASFAMANTISAGEVVTLFGTAIGPSQAATLALDANGRVTTSIGGVEVLFNGVPGPMIYASSTQVSAVVPYEIASPVFRVNVNVQVRYRGQTSNGIAVTQASSAPGIFTANSSGTGPGAILNPNNSVNSPGNPANKGDVVVLYMTGEGQTNPAGSSGSVTRVTTLPNGAPFTPQPLLPVAVRIDNQPALVTFWGEAPGIVAGVMQVNVQIPTGARSGDLSVQVSVGGESTQTGVTVSVR
jgi:uncharacterized protein (TIGR03437 family)